MSSWGLFKSGLGFSETQPVSAQRRHTVASPSIAAQSEQASPSLSVETATSATPSTAAQTKSFSESLTSSTSMHASEFAKSKSLEVTRSTTESTTQLTSELLSRAAADTRAVENAEDDSLRLLRWEAASQQADKDQSEIMHQQWRLFCEQVAMLSSKTISMRGELKDLYRIATQEEADRRAAVEAVQVALRVSEERIFGMLEDLCRSQVSGMAIEMERAERISVCKKITDELEVEKLARVGACGELASDISRLRNMLEESLQKSAVFMKEQSSIIETRVQETDFAARQSVKNLEDQVDAMRKDLECETRERIKLGNAEDAMVAELQDLRNELHQELAERVKGDENCLGTLKQELDKARTERENTELLIEALAKTLSQDYTSQLEKRISQTETFTRNLLEDEAKARAAGDVELGSKMQTDLERMAADLECEAAARIDGDKDTVKGQFVETALKGVTSVTTDLQNQLEQEIKKRIAGEEKIEKLLKEGLESASKEVTSVTTGLQKQLEQEMKVRIAGDEQIEKLLKEGLESASKEITSITTDLQKWLEQEMKVRIAAQIAGDEQMQKLLQEGLESASKEVTSVTIDVQKRLEQEMKIRIAGEEQMGKLLAEGLEKAGSERSEILCAVQMCKSTLDDEVRVRVQGDEELTKNLQDGLEKAGRERSEMARMIESMCEKFKINLSEFESTVSGNKSNFNATIVDLNARLDGLTSTVQADAVLRVAMEGKLEESCKVLRAEIDQALNGAVASLNDEIFALGGKKDTLDAVMREMRAEVEAHKLRADREWTLIHKNMQDHKSQNAEHNEAREAVQSSLLIDMEKLWKHEIAQLKSDQDLALQKLQEDHDALRRKQKEFAEKKKEELRRVWEAIDSHTHDMEVADLEEKQEPAKNVIRREIVREAPRMLPPPTQIMAGGHQCYQDVSPVGRATVPVPATAPLTARGMVASNSFKSLTGGSLRTPTRMASPPQTAAPSRGSPAPRTARGSPPRVRPAMSVSPLSPRVSLTSSQKLLGPFRPPTVERVDVIQLESASSGLRSASPSVHSSQNVLLDTQSPAVGFNLSGGFKFSEVSPNLPKQRRYATSIGKAIHDVRSTEWSRSNDSSTVTDSIFKQEKIFPQHLEALVGKIEVEENSDLDPETRRDKQGLSNVNDICGKCPSSVGNSLSVGNSSGEGSA